MSTVNPPIVLLGPQRRQQTVAKAIADLGLSGPLATITAGWEEREREDAELSLDLGGRTRNLGLFPRAEEVFAEDPAVQAAIADLQDQRRRLRDLYRLRLGPQLRVCRTLLSRTDPARPDDLHGPEIDSAIEAVRALDRHHHDRVAELEAASSRRLAGAERPSLDRHRAELAAILADAEGLLVAGGNVATLLTLLRLFDIPSLAAGKPVVAWSGGAMVVCERVVLFHDSPPQGGGDAELYGPGLGLARGVIPLPHARHRLQLNDPHRVALFARRFAPDLCVALDYGGRIDEARPDAGADNERGPGGESPVRGVGWRPAGAASVLAGDGRIVGPSSLETRLGPPGRPGPAPVAGRSEAGRAPAARDPTMVIDRLREAAQHGDGAVDAAIASMEVPVVGDGWALLIYRGPAEVVRFQHWLSGLPSAPPFERLPGTDLWTLEIQIQDRARIEYKLEVLRGPHRELIRDPLNPAVANDPFGGNSVVQAIGYTTPPWTMEQDSTRRGTIHRAALASTAYGETRPYSLYLPARFRTTRRYPLLIVHDGLDYLHYANLVPVLDNLIHRLEIPPLVAALIPSNDRTTEYVADERHARFIVEDLLPGLERELPLLDDPADRALVGASLGAVAALHTAWSNPGSFGKLLLQSGSFAFTDIGDHDLGPIFDPVVAFVNRFRTDPGRPADRIFLSAGIYESLIYFNRSLLPVFQSTGAEVRLVEAQDGHNWQNWRDQLREGLTWLFPGPLAMDYE